MKNFSTSEVLKVAWEQFREQPWVLIGATALIYASSFILDVVSEGDANGGTALLSLAFMAVSIILSIGLVNISLKIERGEVVVWNDLWEKIKLFWKFLGAAILQGIAVMIALVPAVIGVVGLFGFILGAAFSPFIASEVSPGLLVGLSLLILLGSFLAVYISLGLLFYQYLVVDKELGPVQSLKTSWNITKGNRLQLITLLVVLLLLNFIGALLVGIGLLVTIPFTILAFARVYQMLISESLEVGPANLVSLTQSSQERDQNLDQGDVSKADESPSTQ